MVLTLNPAAVFELRPAGLLGLEDLVAVLGFQPAQKSEEPVAGAAENVLNGVSRFLNDLLLRAISSQTKGEFIAFRQESFPQYANAVTSAAKLVRTIVPGRAVIQRRLNECICRVEAEIREQGLNRFGAAARDQAVFTIWSIRRTSKLIAQIAASGEVPEAHRNQDRELAYNFSLRSAWAQFNLNCLLASIRSNIQFSWRC